MITKGMQALQKLPERVHEKLWSDSNTRQTVKNRDEVTKKLHELADKDYEILSGKLENVKQFENVEQFLEQFSQWQGHDGDQLIAEQIEFYELGQHDDQCIRQLAKFLGVNLTQILSVVNQLLENTNKASFPKQTPASSFCEHSMSATTIKEYRFRGSSMKIRTWT